jgi:gliding motility-associated-like protein
MFMTGRTVLILLFVYFSTQNSHGQVNLVPNPAFEEYTDCPNSLNQFENCLNWYNLFQESPEYYNACNSNPASAASVPIHSNVFYKQPRSGNAYAGIISTFLNSNVNIREYIGVKLNAKLKKGVLYYSEFYVSPRNNIMEDNNFCVIDRFGCSFSRDTIFDVLLPSKPMKKQNYFGHQGGLIEELDTWTKISGCVLGDNEEYVTIGNFDENEDVSTKTECFDIFPSAAYYYIDDVGVYEFDPLPDTLLLCEGESREIGQKFLDGMYHWNTGSQDSTIVVSQSGTYIVDVDMGSCILSDTVVVIDMSDLNAYLPKDTTICDGTKFSVEIPIPGQILWNTGSSHSTISISEEGFYSVQIENQCGTFNLSFDVMTQQCDCQVITPNIFSPNDDGLNDEMLFYMDCQYPFYIKTLRIYDRWGSLVFQEKQVNDNKIVWNGKLNGIELSTGVYCWVINYSYLDNGQEISKIKSGNVTIIH